MIDHNINGYIETFKMGNMQAFVDADHASDLINRKFICRYVFTIFGGTVCFNSTKQRSIIGSTIEAKYMALSLAPQQAIWTRHLILSIEDTSTNLTILLLFRDNKVSLQLFKEVSNISKIKHIDISFYQIIDKIKNRSIKLFCILSEEMLADDFIKPFPQQAFEDKQVHMNVIDIERL